MLLALTGSSGSGKTTLAYAVAGLLPSLVVHDFDEWGVPSDADTAWRQRTGEHWLRRAHALQESGQDLLLTGQSPLGEVLATPSAYGLDGIAVCLVDIDDDERVARLADRDGGRWSAEQLDAFVSWGRWHRGHVADPQHRPDAIIRDCWPGMLWGRWSDWSAGDTRWHTDILDTTGATVDESVDALVGWVEAQRDARREGRLALAPGWSG